MKLGYLQKHDDAKNMHRYYHLTIAPTLFGEFALVREWGRIGSRKGQRKEDWFATETQALDSGLKLRKLKKKNGYK